MDEIVGPIRNPTNITYQHRGSIHDDETARQLGLRGGTIAASTHLDQFPPVLMEAFGRRWFETGCLSLYFRHATTDGEPVQVRLQRPESSISAQMISARMVTPDDVLVAEGTASVGDPPERSALSTRDLRHDDTGLRILADLAQGDPIGPHAFSITAASQAARIDEGLITEPLGWYRSASPWGGPIAPPSAIVDALTTAASASLLPRIGSAVGLWGAIEVRMWDGPVLLDTDYRAVGSVAALGDSPRTEILWYDVDVLDRGSRVASMRILTRFMKASSPLYAS
jgi:hypothetical protein